MKTLGLEMLRVASSQAWLDTVMEEFDLFLQDHADCERKASAMAMSFVAKYPDRKEIIPELIDTAVEELQHFRQVYKLMEKRGIPLGKEMGKDPYVSKLLKLCHQSPADRFLDRLLIASVVEWRGCERFKMIAEAQTEPELGHFYQLLWESEARHGEIFTEMAQHYFSNSLVEKRLNYWLEAEAEILQGLALRSALH